HDVDRHLLDLIEALRLRAADDPAAADQVADDADEVRADFGAGVPFAFRRDRIEHVADLLAVDGEEDLPDARREHLRQDFRFELRDTADVRVGFRHDDTNHQFSGWLLGLLRCPRHSKEENANCGKKLNCNYINRKNVAGSFYRGRNGPPPASAAT